MKRIQLTFCLAIFCSALFAQDTTVVQTFDFSDITKRRGWYQFPPEDSSWEKILMQYTIKCDPATTQDNFACGEWDYTTYTNVFNYTGDLDSNILSHPLFIVNGSSPSEFSYHSDQVYNTIESWQYDLSVDNVVSENTYLVNPGTDLLNWPLNSSQSASRAQFIIYQSELTSTGIAIGDIHRMNFDVETDAVGSGELKISLSNTSLDELDPTSVVTNGLQTVYNGPFHSTATGPLNFLDPFSWNGTSNILVDVQFSEADAGSDVVLNGSATGMNSSIYTAFENKYLSFDQGTYIDVPSDAFANISDEVTVSFWCYGDVNYMPANSYAFEGVNENGQRILNSHLPWSNGQVYWDAGYSGGYDRINAQAGTFDYEGQWNHWAFTKDAVSGSMKIYLNGALWLSGVDKFRTMEGITKFRIGSSSNPLSTTYYRGYIDEFRVWSQELEQTEISEWMNKQVDNTHPNFDALELYYDFEEDFVSTTIDVSGNGHDGTAYGLPSQMTDIENESSFGYLSSTQRPSVTLLQGVYESTLDSTLIITQEAVQATTITNFSDTTLLPDPTSVDFGWESEYGYTYDPSGEIIDSTYYGSLGTITNQDLTYWGAPFEIVETVQLGNFVTPYGIGLDLGADGWTYNIDVSDYVLYLTDSVDIRAHNTQELLDLKFYFIEGTPAREVISSQIIWSGDWSLSSITDNVNLPSRDVQLNPLATQYKIKTRATGHGFGSGINCSEFCATQHFIRINGVEQFSWQNWKECADNPIIDQGGTWIYDRAGWCPGTFADTYEFDITEFVEQGEINAIDYGIDPVSIPDGNQRVAFQLFEYGPFNFQNDAEIIDIVSPTNADNYSKINPVCGNAKVVIRNRGENDLTSASIIYNIQGGPELTYAWSGILEFDETELVTLPINDVAWWGASNIFKVRIEDPNGVEDEYPNNNFYKSHFVGTPMYPQNLEIRFRTNNFPFENEWKIFDEVGNVVESMDFSVANFTHKDTINLAPGCYRLRVDDSGDDGLSFFANNDGTGYVRIRDVDASNTIITFEPNYGKFVEHQFTIGYSIGINELNDNAYIYVYPNPTKDILNIEMDAFLGDEYTIELFNSTGKQVRVNRFANTQSEITHQMQVTDLSAGIYYLRVSNGLQFKSKKIIIE